MPLTFYLSIDARGMNMPPLDAPHHGESNELCFVFVRPVDKETH
jgi:hypothetical protein